MSKKMTKYQTIELESIEQKEGEESYIVNLAVDTGKKKKEMEQVKFKPLPRGKALEVKTSTQTSLLHSKFLIGYAMLFLIEEKKLNKFHFICHEIQMEYKKKEQVSILIEDAWYENDSFYKYIEEEKKIKKYIKQEMMGKSTETQKTYTHSLKTFFKHLFFFERDTFPTYNEEHVNRFIAYLEDRKLSATYINKIFTAVNMYAKYQENILNTYKIRLPKVPNLLEMSPKSLQNQLLEEINADLQDTFLKSQIPHMWQFLPNLGKQRDHYRNWILFRLMLSCGLRIGEATNIQIDDLHLDGSRTESRYVVIRKTKTQSERKIPLDREITSLLKEYIAFRESNDLEIELQKELFNRYNGRSTINIYDGMTKKEISIYEKMYEELKMAQKEGDEEEVKFLSVRLHMMAVDAATTVVRERFVFNPYLFVSNRYKRVANRTMMNHFQKAGITSHQLRHTAIKNLVDNNVSINKIQKFSGHKSADMVLRYSQPTFEEIASEVEKHKKF
ncbi:hypothetical protein BCJMU51_p307 (plasmid) [Bacillus cereus]|uniref:tyrosine-type recombinase/integrase n=1 Tax=Bacillus TaxID=1386 RepID=UPI001BB3118D|nr:MULTISPECIES: site-specific integrase [Bacillus]BCC44668.1 hypothetical protein BCJMU01_p320 [Bacillus cereus]BCC50609.1 hypothetical protein BCJMU02_p306 [Bacillus cereus]BCC74253.1 hypothetical protein BCJMU51_p307 [Bacillus cereus]BCD33034.1 hypothetical protein BC30102_p703 [Bacillus cereus]HDR8026486.1 site-specific integrase [Bacillus cereus]